MMCPNFIYWILQVLKDSKVSKSLINQGLLACFLNCYCYRHSDRGVVTCADESHHFYASGTFAIASGWIALAQKPCRISLFDIFASQNLYSLNTSFSVLLNALYRVLRLSYIGLWINSKVVCNFLLRNLIRLLTLISLIY